MKILNLIQKIKKKVVFQFFETMWSYKRFTTKEDIADCLMYVFQLSNCPDAVDKKDSLFNVSKNNVKHANYVFTRLFNTRVFDYIRVVQQTLMKNTVQSIDNVIHCWKWSDIFTAYKKLLQHGDTDIYQYNEETQDDSKITEEQFDKILENTYKITAPSIDLKNKAKQLEETIKGLRKLKESLDWFGFHVTSNASEVANAIFTL